jgi:hypothetical protein
MGIYGISYYGLTKYGSNNVSVAYDASPFVAEAVGYTRIQLTWNVPNGSWSFMKLVRNKYGFPLSIEDGDVLFTDPQAGVRTSYTDYGQTPNNVGLQGGAGYYYTLFVYSTINFDWEVSGNAVGISVLAYGGLSAYDQMPAVYKTQNLTNILSADDNGDLQNFLDIFDYYFDYLHTFADFIWNTYDVTQSLGTIIPTMFEQFGIAFEPELGFQRARAELANVAIINQNKGVTNGISNYIKTFTGYQPIISVNQNMMLSSEDSSFEHSVGHWTAFDTAITGPTLSSYTVANSPTILPYVSATFPAGYTNLQNGFLQVEVNYPELTEFACGYSDPINRGIPVKAGLPYTFSFYTYAKTTARSIGTKIYWYDRNGVSLGASSEPKINNTIASWGTRPTVTATAPTNAYYAVPSIKIYNAIGSEYHYFDSCQFEQASSVTDFVEARGLLITLAANRVNELINPGFDQGFIAPWVTANGTVVLDTTTYETSTNVSKTSLKWTASTTGSGTLLHDYFMPVLPGFSYTIDGYIKSNYNGINTNDKQGYWFINWYDSTKTLISTSAGTPRGFSNYLIPSSYSRSGSIVTINVTNTFSVGNQIRIYGFSYATNSGIPDGTYTITSATTDHISFVATGLDISSVTVINEFIQDLTLGFARYREEDTSPLTAAYAKIGLTWTNIGSDKTIWVDSAMFEQNSAAGSYFDGSGGFSKTADILWEGTPGQSRSHYYKNRTSAQGRLKLDLPKYLMDGTTFQLKIAQPGVLG